MFCLWAVVLDMCYKHVPFFIHSNISKFKVAVAAVSWESVFKMGLSHMFWARQIRQKRLWFVLGTHKNRHMLITLI